MKTDPHIISHIFDFNEQIIGIKDSEINPLTPAQLEWTLKAFREETQEFHDAYDQQDVVGMVDACLDLVYFAVGTLKKMGLSRDQAVACFHAIHSANMTKQRGGKATRGNFEEDATKPAEFVGPEAIIMQIIMEKNV